VGCSTFTLAPSPLGLDFYATRFAGAVVAIAAPWQAFGIFDEAALYGVVVDVPEFLDVLSVGEDVEVVVAGFARIACGRL